MNGPTVSDDPLEARLQRYREIETRTRRRSLLFIGLSIALGLAVVIVAGIQTRNARDELQKIKSERDAARAELVEARSLRDDALDERDAFVREREGLSVQVRRVQSELEEASRLSVQAKQEYAELVDRIERLRPVATPISTPTAEGPRACTVTTFALNLRTEPNPDIATNIIVALPSGTALVPTARSGDGTWIRVDRSPGVPEPGWVRVGVSGQQYVACDGATSALPLA